MRKSRWLFQTLILSVGLNLALLGVFFYFLIRDNPLQFAYRPVTEAIESQPSPSILPQFQTLSFEHLTELLSDERIVEQGYRVRDFAVGALVTFYEFDLNRAVGRGGLQRRKWIFDEAAFLLFPGLAEEDFLAIQHFAQRERWPYTTKGLFQQMARGENEIALLSRFCHTTEFIALETLFARTGLPIQKGTLLGMVIEGGWDPFSQFIDEERERCDFSDRKRQDLLLNYITSGSKTAAYLLLITDSTFAKAQLDDAEVSRIIELASEPTQEAITFLREMVDSSRGEHICERARERLSEFLGEEIAGRFTPRPGIGELRPVFREKPPASLPPNIHVIQPGESLWLIAKKYQVSIESLMEMNGLQSTVIQPGKALKIP